MLFVLFQYVYIMATNQQSSVMQYYTHYTSKSTACSSQPAAFHRGGIRNLNNHKRTGLNIHFVIFEL